jgi:hypothetical protein
MIAEKVSFGQNTSPFRTVHAAPASSRWETVDFGGALSVEFRTRPDGESDPVFQQSLCRYSVLRVLLIKE